MTDFTYLNSGDCWKSRSGDVIWQKVHEQYARVIYSKSTHFQVGEGMRVKYNFRVEPLTLEEKAVLL